MRLRFVCTILLAVLVATALPALAVERAVSGTISKIDTAAKTIAVKTADGAEHVFHYTEHTVVKAGAEAGKGAKTSAVDSYLAGKQGTHVVVHYTEEGAQKTATGVDDLGKGTVKATKGTVTKVDEAGHTMTVKTENGAEETYHVAKDATVDTKDGVVKGAHYAEKGAKVTVQYTEEAGQKVAHFIKHL